MIREANCSAQSRNLLFDPVFSFVKGNRLIVVSSKIEKGLDDAMPLLREMLQSYSYMDVKLAPGAAPKISRLMTFSA